MNDFEELIKDTTDHIIKKRDAIDNEYFKKFSDILLEIQHNIAGCINVGKTLNFEDSKQIIFFSQSVMLSEIILIINPVFFENLINSLLVSGRFTIAKNKELFESFEDLYWFLYEDISEGFINRRNLLLDHINGEDKKEEYLKVNDDLQKQIPIFSEKVRVFFDIYYSFFD